MNGDMIIVQPSDMDGMRAEISPVVQYARELAVTSPDIYEMGMQKLLVIKELRKKVNEKFDPIIRKAYDAHKAVCNLKREITDPLDMAERIIDPKCRIYRNEQEAERQRLEAKIQAEALAKQRKLDEEAKAKAQREIKKGNTERAEAIMETIPQVPIPIVESIVPKVKGASFREIWHAEVVDEKKVPRQYLIPDMKKLDGIARATKGEMNIPGIRFCKEEITAGRRVE